jgi:hypothetical protein
LLEGSQLQTMSIRGALYTGSLSACLLREKGYCALATPGGQQPAADAPSEGIPAGCAINCSSQQARDEGSLLFFHRLV